jgi:hypothetical protein
VAIATTTLNSNSGTIVFSSIPSTYTDLRLVITGTMTAGGYLPSFIFNSDTGTNYSYTEMYGTGSAASSTRASSTNYIWLGTGGSWSATIPAFCTIDIFSYTGSTNKTCLYTYSEDRNGSGFVGNGVGLWRSISAITTLTLRGWTNGTTAQFLTGTTATLYGIL